MNDEIKFYEHPLKLSNLQFTLVLITLSSVGIALVTYFIDDLWKKQQFPYPENLHTLIIEVGIGIIITLLIYTFSIQQQNKMKRLVCEIKKIEDRQQKAIEEQEIFRKKQYDWAIDRLKSLFPDFMQGITNLEENVKLYIEMPKPTEQSDLLESLIEAQEILREYYVNRIERISDQSVGIISPEILEKIDEIITGAKKKSRIITDKGIRYDRVYYKHIVDKMDYLLKNHLT